MAGIGISDLRPPGTIYRVDKRTKHPSGEVRFETEQDSKREDARRARGLSRTIAKGILDPDEEARARRLQVDLETAARTGEYAPTLACHLYMRWLRICIAGHLWKLMRTTRRHTTATIILRSWEFSPDALWDVDPRKLLTAFRTDLYRAGIRNVDGWLFAYLHGEFDPIAKVYRLHLHIALTKSMVPVLDRIRAVGNYKSTRLLPDGSPSPVFRRVWIRRKPLINMPEPVTYVVQSFWPARPIHIDEQGRRSRLRQKGAIREPYHSQVLLWLDRWKVEDLTLMVGLRVTKAGLIRTRRRL
jgi:hypothetical protein